MRDSDALARSFILLVFAWHLIGALRTFKRVEHGFVRITGLVPAFGFMYLYFETGQTTMYLWTAIAGFTGLLGSIAMFEWARRSVQGKMFSFIMSEDAPTFVHAEGAYVRIRHPFYTSYLIAFFSSALVFPSLGTFGAALAMLAYFYAVTSFEEAKFARTGLAPVYGAYRRRAGRFFPRLRAPRLS